MKTTELKILVAGALLFMTASAHALQPEVLYGFQLGPRSPVGSLIQGDDGNFYGTTANGGSSYIHPSESGYGTVFKLTTNGILTSLVSFTGDNSAYPQAKVFLGKDGIFYGTTGLGGSSYVIAQERKLSLHGRGRGHQPVAFLSAFRSLNSVDRRASKANSCQKYELPQNEIIPHGNE